MSSALVSEVTDVFKSQMLEPFAANSGESESSMLRGFETSVGTMVATLASRIGQSGFSRQILDLINSPANDTGVLDNARSLVGVQQENSLGSRFRSLLFGGKQSVITDRISSASGLHEGTAASLLGVSAPLLLGALGNRVRDGRMDSSRLTSFLTQEAGGIKGTLPEGIESLLDSEARTIPTASPVVAQAVVEERSNRWVWPVLLAVALLAGLLWWFNSRGQLTQPASAVANFVTRTLPGNVDLRIPVGRMEDHLLGFIQNPAKGVDETTWFDFDRLLFDTDSATLQSGSEEQLRNITAILKAYPNAHVQIGGYTDNTGDATANLTLSRQRADTVRQQLIGMGVAADRMESQGYGEQHPVADNSTAEGRQLNRRISMRVTQK